MPSLALRILRQILLVIVTVAVGACGSDGGTNATPTPAPVDPAGVWNFSIVNTLATGVCVGEEGTSSAHPITITKTGSRPPYQVTARGFLGLAANVLTGTFDAENKLLISGSYPEDGGTTTATHALTATSQNQMLGTETWDWAGEGGTCPDSKSAVTADRQ